MSIAAPLPAGSSLQANICSAFEFLLDQRDGADLDRVLGLAVVLFVVRPFDDNALVAIDLDVVRMGQEFRFAICGFPAKAVNLAIPWRARSRLLWTDDLSYCELGPSGSQHFRRENTLSGARKRWYRGRHCGLGGLY